MNTIDLILQYDDILETFITMHVNDEGSEWEAEIDAAYLAVEIEQRTLMARLSPEELSILEARRKPCTGEPDVWEFL